MAEEKFCFNCGQFYVPRGNNQCFCCPECKYDYNHKDPMKLRVTSSVYEAVASGRQKKILYPNSEHWRQRFRKKFYYYFCGDTKKGSYTEMPKSVLLINAKYPEMTQELVVTVKECDEHIVLTVH